jgi:hypothetical protein
MVQENPPRLRVQLDSHLMMMSDDTVRTIIHLLPEQVEALTEISRRQGVSRAEVVRRAIDMYLKQRPSEREDRAFGIWKKRRRDALRYEDKIRAEWTRK